MTVKSKEKEEQNTIKYDHFTIDRNKEFKKII